MTKTAYLSGIKCSETAHARQMKTVNAADLVFLINMLR